MKIERIETYLSSNVAVVRILTDDGIEGNGQTSPYGADISVDVLHKMVARFFLGQNPWDVERLVERCLNSLYKFSGTFLCRALCGIDTALWDILGKASGQPVYRLLGGLERDTIPMYASSMRRHTTPEEEVERFAAAIDELGFRCIKIKIGETMGRDRDASPGRTERFVEHARTTLGPGVGIHADGNGCYSAAKAIEVGRLLEAYDCFHYEEPCPFMDLESTAQVAAALDIPVAGGEQDNSLEQFKRMIEMGAVDIVQPDIGYIGGVSRTRKVAEMAQLANIPCTPHCANRSLQMYTLHLAAAMPSCYQFHEWSIEPDSWANEIYEPHLVVRNGEVAVPTGPGWGLSVLPEYLAKADHRVSHL